MPDIVFHGDVLTGAGTRAVTARVASTSGFERGSILVCASLTLRDYDSVISSSAVICSEGGRTGHLPSICRVRGIPMVILDLRQLETIKPGNLVRVDPGNSTVTVLEEVLDNETSTGGVKVALPSGLPHLEAVIAGAADVTRVNNSEMSSHVDSFFMREEFLWTARSISSLSPEEALSLEGPETVAASTGQAVGQLLTALKPGQRLTFRLLDLRSDEASALALESGRSPHEPNPELGLHGARWILRTSEYQESVRRLAGILDRSRLTIAIPFINDESELDLIFEKFEVENRRDWGVFVETPAAVDRLPHLLDRGISVVNVGTKDLVQFILAADRNNKSVAHVYDTRHPSVMNALSRIVEHCAGYDITLRIFVLGGDLDYYCSYLPEETRFMMCTRELLDLSPDT